MEGNIYDNPDAAQGYFTIKSFRKYTWSSPDSKLDPMYVRYEYHVELEFNGSYTFCGRTYTEKSWGCASTYRKRNMVRSLKYMAEYLVRDCLKVLDTTIPQHNINVKRVILKTKEA